MICGGEEMGIRLIPDLECGADPDVRSISCRPDDGRGRTQGSESYRAHAPRAYPYGIYDLSWNGGFVNVGTDRDSGAFAVASIRGWWHFEGRRLYPKAERLLITADGGGSNGYRLRLWKLELQKWADAAKLSLRFATFRREQANGTRGAATRLRDYETSVRLISATKTSKGLTVSCRLDRRKYPTGRKVTKEEMATFRIVPRTFRGEWNYVIRPR